MQIGAAVVNLWLEDEGGEVNPNIAEPGLLQALLLQIGLDRRAAVALAGAILDWCSLGQRLTPSGSKAAQCAAKGCDYSPPNAPFEARRKWAPCWA